MAIVESESDLMMGWLMIRTFYNSPNIPDYPGKADALIRLKRAMRKFILGAFQIQSTNTSVRSIAADAEFIQRTVYYRADGLRKARA